MKKIFALLTVFTVAFTLNTMAQVMSQKAVWVTIKCDQLRCYQCKPIVENALIRENYANFEKGIIEWKINLLSGEIRIKYYPDRVSEDDLRLCLNNAGFDADTTTAEASAYKKLPTSCLRSKEGGGPQKGKPCHIDPNQ